MPDADLFEPPPPGTTPPAPRHYHPWDNDDVVLTEAFLAVKTWDRRKNHKTLRAFCEKMAAQLQRTPGAVQNRLGVLELVTFEHWSDADLKFLRDQYPLKGMRLLREHLGRTAEAIYQKAKELGLSGIPQGLVSLTQAAKKECFSRRGLLLILENPKYEGKCRLYRFRRTQGSYSHIFVDPLDVADVLKEHLATETLASAAERLHLDPRTLRANLKAAGIVRESSAKHHRLTPAEWDALVSARMWESLPAASTRLKAPINALRATVKAMYDLKIRKGIRIRLRPAQYDAAWQCMQKTTPPLGVMGAKAAAAMLQQSVATLDRIGIWGVASGHLPPATGNLRLFTLDQWRSAVAAYGAALHGGESITQAAARLKVSRFAMARACRRAGIGESDSLRGVRLPEGKAEEVLRAYRLSREGEDT